MRRAELEAIAARSRRRAQRGDEDVDLAGAPSSGSCRTDQTPEFRRLRPCGPIGADQSPQRHDLIIGRGQEIGFAETLDQRSPIVRQHERHEHESGILSFEADDWTSLLSELCGS
jgi:hypothetical protein